METTTSVKDRFAEEREAMLNVEKNRRSSNSFISGGNPPLDEELVVVDVEYSPESNGMPAFNAIVFANGLKMSTSRFFAAKGIKWPVGTNTAKLSYVLDCLNNGTELRVKIKSVDQHYLIRSKGDGYEYYSSSAKSWQECSAEVKDGAEHPIFKDNTPDDAVRVTLFTFHPVTFQKLVVK